MVTGAHVLLYSSDADADRAFVRDVLGLPFVDAGNGWLIFALPPSELAVHPVGGEAVGGAGMIGGHVYLMCDDVRATVAELATRGVRCGAVHEERWGLRTTIPLPSGALLGLYQPTHPVAAGRWPA